MKDTQRKTKSEEIKYLKKQKKFWMTLGILLAVAIVYFLIKSAIYNMRSQTEVGLDAAQVFNVTYENLTTSEKICAPGTLSGSIARGLTLFMDNLFTAPTSFLTKLLIILGILYGIQIVFTAGIDLIELILLLFVAIKRGIMFGVRKYKERKNGIV